MVVLFFPLTVLLVPIIDGTFVVMKRLKYRRPVYAKDRWHLHDRLGNIGFSQRRSVIYLYGWTLALAALSLALRFVPYSDHHGHFKLGWTLVLIGFGLLAARGAPVVDRLGAAGGGREPLPRLRARDPQVLALPRPAGRQSAGGRAGVRERRAGSPPFTTPAAWHRFAP